MVKRFRRMFVMSQKEVNRAFDCACRLYEYETTGSFGCYMTRTERQVLSALKLMNKAGLSAAEALENFDQAYHILWKKPYQLKIKFNHGKNL